MNSAPKQSSLARWPLLIDEICCASFRSTLTRASQLRSSLSEKYRTACREIRSIGWSHAARRLAKLLLEWNDKHDQARRAEDGLKLTLTQEGIGQAIGTTRETVVRVLADFR